VERLRAAAGSEGCVGGSGCGKKRNCAKLSEANKATAFLMRLCPAVSITDKDRPGVAGLESSEHIKKKEEGLKGLNDEHSFTCRRFRNLNRRLAERAAGKEQPGANKRTTEAACN